MAFNWYNRLSPYNNDPFTGLPRPINEIPTGMQHLGYNLPRRDDAYGRPRFEPWYKLPTSQSLSNHYQNVNRAWAPWYNRDLTPGEQRTVNPPAFSAPRKRYGYQQQFIENPGQRNATGRPLPKGRGQGPITRLKGRYVNTPWTTSKREKFTPEMENIRNELYQLGYPKLPGDVDFNPQWGTTGGLGYEHLGATAPPKETKKGGGGTRKRFDRSLENIDNGGYSDLTKYDRRRERGGGGNAPPGERGRLGAGMAAGDTTGAGRRSGGGMATGGPVSDLGSFMSWLGNDNAEIKKLYNDYINNGWTLPDGWQTEYKYQFNKGATIQGKTQEDFGLNDAEWADLLTQYEHSGGAGFIEYSDSRDSNLENFVRNMLLNGAAEQGNKDDPTQTKPDTKDIPGLGDRNLTGGTGFPWAGNIPDPFAQNAPAWARGWMDQIGNMMPQVADQYRAMANLGSYGQAGMQTIRAPLNNATNQVLESLGPFVNETTQGIRQNEANQRRRAAQMAGESFRGAGAQRPGLVPQMIATNITAPSLQSESDRIFAANQQAKGMADQLIMNQGQFDTALTERNMASKAGVGLPGLSRTLGQMQSMAAGRPWDFSMENKFGYAPERAGEIQTRIQDYLMNKGYAMDWKKMQENALLSDWGLGRSQQRQYEFQTMLMDLKNKYDKEMKAQFGGNWFEKFLAIGAAVASKAL